MNEPCIFLCHASEDKPRVRELYHRLKQAGYHPWLDKEDLLPGQDWRHKIEKIIRDPYNIIVVCLSCNSVTKRGVVQQEIKWALDVLDQTPEGSIYLIPARLEDCQVPDRLSELHWVELFEPDGFGKLKQALDFELGKRQPQPVAKPKQRKLSSRSMASGQKTIQVLIDESLAGKHLAVSCYYEENPITGGAIIPARFLDALIAEARNAGVIVLDYNPEGRECPYCYIVSRNLVEMAVEMKEFAQWREEFGRVLVADEKRDYAMSPWGDFSARGAKLFGEAVRSLKQPVLAICRICMDLEENGQGEPNYSYGLEIPTLSRDMSIVFDIREERGDWTKIARLLDYFVDDMEGRMTLMRGARR